LVEIWFKSLLCYPLAKLRFFAEMSKNMTDSLQNKVQIVTSGTFLPFGQNHEGREGKLFSRRENLFS